MSLTIELLAGMGNRLRAMVSAICWAEDRDLSLHVVWTANDPACMARFETLFERSSLPRWVTVDMGPMMDQCVMVLSPEDMVTHATATRIRSYGHFYQKDPERWLRYLRALRPIAPLVPNHPLFTMAPIGVHVRRGDHVKARHSSPISEFIKRMDAEPADTFFVVATDSNTERTTLETQYPGRVWFPATSLSRMTQKGMNDAVTDFMALSRCKRILGSYNSSFSELAAMYGDVPLEVITVVEKGD